jgi:hypothetical protein
LYGIGEGGGGVGVVKAITRTASAVKNSFKSFQTVILFHDNNNAKTFFWTTLKNGTFISLPAMNLNHYFSIFY